MIWLAASLVWLAGMCAGIALATHDNRSPVPRRRAAVAATGRPTPSRPAADPELEAMLAEVARRAHDNAKLAVLDATTDWADPHGLERPT